MKITIAQFEVTADQEKNYNTISDSIDKAVENNSNWMLTPEGSLSGYMTNGGLKDHTDTKTIVDKLEKKLSNLNIGIALGTEFVEPDGFPRNQLRFYAPQGRLVAVHEKQLLCTGWGGGGEQYLYMPGSELTAFPITEKTRASGLICNDVWATPGVSPQGNPYLVQRLVRYYGVGVVFVAVNTPDSEHDSLVRSWHETHLQMFAREWGLWIIVANSLSSNLQGYVTSNCRSGVIAPTGEWHTLLPDSEPCARTIDLDF